MGCRLLATIGVGTVLQGACGPKLALEDSCPDAFVSMIGIVAVAFYRRRNVYAPSYGEDADSGWLPFWLPLTAAVMLSGQRKNSALSRRKLLSVRG